MRRVDIPRELLRELYLNQKLTTYQIADKLRFCQGTIWKRLHEYGIKPRLSYTPIGFTKAQLKEWYTRQKLSTWKIEKQFGYSRGTVHRKLNEFGLNTRNISASHVQFPRKDFGGNVLKKAYFVGFRVGDLNVVKRGLQSETITIKCASTKEGQIELFKKLFASYGHVLLGKPTKEGKINMEANLNPSFSFLLRKDPGSYKWVFQSKETFFAFLAGFFDAEGSFFISNGQGVFCVGNYDSALLKKIKKYLKKFGIETPKLSVYYQSQRRVYNGYLSKKDYYTLRCSRKVYLLKLINNIKPHLQHPDKLRALKGVKANIINRNRLYGNLLMCF